MKKYRSPGLIIAIGWALAPCALAAFSFLLNRSRYNYSLRWADVWLYLFIVGLSFGMVIGLTLRWSKPRLRWPGVALIIAGWGLGLLATYIFFHTRNLVYGTPWLNWIFLLLFLVLSGAIGGVCTGLALRLFQNPQTIPGPDNSEIGSNPPLGWSQVALITYGWAIGLAVTGGLLIALFYLIMFQYAWFAFICLPFIWFTASASGGAIGSSIMTRQLNRRRSTQISTDEIVWMVMPVIGLALLVVGTVTLLYTLPRPSFNMSRCQPDCREVNLNDNHLNDTILTEF
jgi:hypothetical protein